MRPGKKQHTAVNLIQIKSPERGRNGFSISFPSKARGVNTAQEMATQSRLLGDFCDGSFLTHCLLFFSLHGHFWRSRVKAALSRPLFCLPKGNAQ